MNENNFAGKIENTVWGLQTKGKTGAKSFLTHSMDENTRHIKQVISRNYLSSVLHKSYQLGNSVINGMSEGHS